jgi:YVTN family beta-propeller protein
MYFRIILTLVSLLVSANLAFAAPFAYIANSSSNTVTVIDTMDLSVLEAGIPVGQYPYGVAVSKAGDKVYITNQLSKNISVIDAATNTVLRTIPFSKSGTSYKPGGLAINTAGTLLYVANQDIGTIEVVNLGNDTVTATIATGNFPEGVALSPDGTRLYVANSGSDTVSVINTSTNTKVTDVSLGANASPFGIVAHPVQANNRVYVANNRANSVSVIDTTTNSVIQTVSLGTNAAPTSVAINSDGTTLYSANAGLDTNQVTKIDTTTYATSTLLLDGPTGTMPFGISVVPISFGDILITNSLKGNVSVVEAKTDSFLSTVQAGDSPHSLGNFIGPDVVEIIAYTGANGTITPPGKSLVAKGYDKTYTITPESNDFRIQEIRIDNGILNDPTTNQPYMKYPNTYTFPAVTTSHTIAAVFTQNVYSLSVAKHSANMGVGTVTSNPPGILCNDACIADDAIFDGKSGITVTLTATPGPASSFIGWDSGRTPGNAIKPPCSSTSPTCTFVIDRLYPVIYAKFDVATSDKIKIGSTYYSTIQGGFTAASGTVDMSATSDTFIESPNLNKAGAVITLKGAYPTNQAFTAGTQVPTNPTKIQGTLTITSGTLVAEYISIR